MFHWDETCTSITYRGRECFVLTARQLAMIFFVLSLISIHPTKVDLVVYMEKNLKFSKIFPLKSFKTLCLNPFYHILHPLSSVYTFQKFLSSMISPLSFPLPPLTKYYLLDFLTILKVQFFYMRKKEEEEDEEEERRRKEKNSCYWKELQRNLQQ